MDEIRSHHFEKMGTLVGWYLQGNQHYRASWVRWISSTVWMVAKSIQRTTVQKAWVGDSAATAWMASLAVYDPFHFEMLAAAAVDESCTSLDSPVNTWFPWLRSGANGF